MITLKVIIDKQQLIVLDDNSVLREYAISTGKNGVGEKYGSEKTPRGLHIIRAKIGSDCEPNTIFIKRRPTGEIFTPDLRDQFPTRDWILTRILWLSGLEVGKNRLGDNDTMRRFIYIHGTPDDIPMGIPGSKGCIRMRNKDIMELFDQVPVFTQLHIQETEQG
ncbi:MAG: L,D-transpeptidase [Gammaproteobacteria bacterium]|nr:L,D-transpeptidase [Gammaproteobacteria bacterium]